MVDDHDELAEAADLLEIVVSGRRSSALVLERIIRNQLSIVESMQREFIQGDGEYPREPIAGLRALLEMAVKMPLYPDRQITTRSAELDEAARKSRF